MLLSSGGLKKPVGDVIVEDVSGHRTRTPTHRSLSEMPLQNLRLLHLCAIHLRPRHRAKRHLGPLLMRHHEGRRGFTRPWCTDEHEGAPREIALLDEIDDDTTCL